MKFRDEQAGSEKLFAHRMVMQRVCFEHLLYIGWPKITVQRVLDELPEMWKKLKAENLILPGMTYQGFYEQALFRAATMEAGYTV